MNIAKREYYALVQKAREVYKKSGNIAAFLRESLALDQNTPEIIEISYDLQAGSYVQQTRKNPDLHHAFCAEIAGYLDKYLDTKDSLIEVGCGEATTMFGVFQKLKHKPDQVLGFDISFSRIKVANDFWHTEYAKDIDLVYNSPITNFFVADLFFIPLANQSVDVVYTSHSIEPNGGREVEALKSIFRIARKRVLLFEPYFEEASPDGQARMSSHGYISNIPEAIKAAGGILRNVQKLDYISNPLNPTYLFDIEIRSLQTSTSFAWVDPITLDPLYALDDCFCSPISGLAYPIIRGIPCLRPENSIVATHLLIED